MALGPNYKLPNNYTTFCPNYILPKRKEKTRLRALDLLIQGPKYGG